MVAALTSARWVPARNTRYRTSVGSMHRDTVTWWLASLGFPVNRAVVALAKLSSASRRLRWEGTRMYVGGWVGGRWVGGAVQGLRPG
jgi:hypothetical protein